MTNVGQKKIILKMDATRRKPQDVYPFICGICSNKFKAHCNFLSHLKSHKIEHLDENMVLDSRHVCKLALGKGMQSLQEEKKYTCSLCQTSCPTICLLHSHISKCSVDGSYIFDNSSNFAYPLTIHCAHFENRGSDCVDEDSSLGPAEGMCCGRLTRICQNLSKTMSKAEKVDHILRNVCRLVEKNENKREENRDSIPSENQRVVPDEHKTDRKSRKRSVKKRKFVDFLETYDTDNDVESFSSQTERRVVEKQKLEGVNRCFTWLSKCRQDENTEYLTDETLNSAKIVKVEVTEVSDAADEQYTELGNARTSRRSKKKFEVDEVLDYKSDAQQDHENRDEVMKMDDEEDQLTDHYIPENESKGKKKIKTSTKGKEVKKKIKHKEIVGDKKGDWVSVYDQVIRDNGITLKNKDFSKTKSGKKADVQECCFCGKTLSSYRLRVHMMCHITERPFKCDQCPKTYKYHSHLEDHKASHQQVLPFCCETCGKGYVNHNLLKAHITMKHKNEKPVQCSVCGAGFLNNFRLKRHMNRHTGQKDVQCDLCGMGFTTDYNLRQHVQGVHKKVRSFSCTLCGQLFMTNYQLKVHTIKKHSEERPYHCHVCKAEFVERKELRKHLKKQHDLSMDESISSLTEMPETDRLFEEQKQQGTHGSQTGETKLIINNAATGVSGETGTRHANKSLGGNELGTILSKFTGGETGQGTTSLESLTGEVTEIEQETRVVGLEGKVLSDNSSILSCDETVKNSHSVYRLIEDRVNVAQDINSDISHTGLQVYHIDVPQGEKLTYSSGSRECILVSYDMSNDANQESDCQAKVRPQNIPESKDAALNHENTGTCAPEQVTSHFTVLL